MKTTNPYLAPALRSLLSDTRRTFTPIEAIVLHEAADALEAASAKPAPAAPEKPACEHKRGSGSINTDGSGGFKCFDCPHEVKYPATRTGPEPVPMWATEPPRCEVCGWTLAESRDKGCVAGDCSYRPTEGTEEWYRIKARRDALKAHPAPSSPAAERADEGLEEEAEKLWNAFAPRSGPLKDAPFREDWINVARAARALRRGGVTDPNVANDILNCDECETAIDASRCMKHGLVSWHALRDYVASRSDSGASVVVDREEWDRLRSQPELQPTVDALAAKLAEAEGKNADWSASFDLYHAAEMRGIRMWQDAGPNREMTWPDKGKLTVWLLDQLATARADAERLRSERALIAKVLDAELSSEPLWSVAERLRGERDEAVKVVAQKMDALTAAENRLRTAPPTVAVTDCEGMLNHFRDEVDRAQACDPFSERFAEIFRGVFKMHTRAASVEELGRTLHAASLGHAWSDPTTFHVIAHEALRALGVREAEKNATPFVVDREKVAHGSWGDITRPDWIDVPFTQPFATPVLMVEAAEHLRSYAVSQERCARFWREKFKQEASDHAATQGRFDSGFGKPVTLEASGTKADIVLALPAVDAGPLARLHIEELHRLLAPVFDAAAFSPAHEKAEDAIRRLLAQWRTGIEPRIPPAPFKVEGSPMSPEPFDFYDCDPEQERLSSVEPDVAVSEWLDQHEIEFWPDELPVYGFRRMRFEFDAERILARALEDADEEHGDPDGDGTEPTEAMKDAALAFVEVLDREYVTWACERESKPFLTVNVAEWIRANEPAWCEEPEVAAWIASRPKIEDDELGADSETEARHRAALPEGSAPSPAPAREWTGMQRSGARVVALNVPAKDPLDMTDADLDRICVALANVLPRFVRMKMPNIWPSDFAAEDQDGGKDYDEGFADGQESMRNRCIAALRAQGIEVIEDRKPTEQYRFSVDGKTYTHPSARISVQQILMYAHLTGDSSATPQIGPHTLYRVIDAFPDQQLRPDERVDLTLGQVTKFISVPPGIMGG